jgi:hypothetical protein
MCFYDGLELRIVAKQESERKGLNLFSLFEPK